MRSVALAVALLLAGCGSDESTDGPPAPAERAGDPAEGSAAGAEQGAAVTTTSVTAVEQETVVAGASTVVGPPTTRAAPNGEGEPSAENPAPTTGSTASPAAPDRQAIPTTPLELASALSSAETAVRDDTLGVEERAAWARRQQRLYRVLSANRSWADETLASVDPPHVETVATNWEARLALDALLDTSRLSDSLPAWRIEPPAPAEELLSYYREAADRTGVPWEILAAINLIETRMGRINGISTAGAIGPMQFLPSTWAECCEGDPADDRDAIVGAATYLVDRGARTDLDRAIHGYNNSRHYVQAVRSYAEVMSSDPSAYHGYHGWEVYFLSTEGLISLPVGYEEPEPVKATSWLAANPGHLLDPAPS